MLNSEVAAVVVRVAERRQVVTLRCLVCHVSDLTKIDEGSRATVQPGGGSSASLPATSGASGAHRFRSREKGRAEKDAVLQ